MDAKKVVVKVNMHDDNDRQKVMKSVSSIRGIDSMSTDMKAQTLTVIGTFDPVKVTCRLRKSFNVWIESVGPAKEPEKKNGKKEGEKKEGEKKDGEKKDGEKKDDNNKKGNGNGKKKDANEPTMELVKACRDFHPYMGTNYCVHVQEDPYPCSIL